MEDSIHQRIENLRNETADRVNAIKETVLDALTRHGITHITDDDIHVYSDHLIDDDEVVIVAEANAYMLGIHEMNGWQDYIAVDDTDIK